MEERGDRLLLAVDDAHHLTPEGADYLLALLRYPGLHIVVAGRDLSQFRSLPRMLASGEAELLGPKELEELVGVPRLTLEEIDGRLEAMPRKERVRLLALAGLPFWREEDLLKADLNYTALVSTYGLPVYRRKGVYWPHELLQEALIQRAPKDCLLGNALRLEAAHPALAARLYVRSGHPEQAVILAKSRMEEWISESKWSEVESWLADIPKHHLGPLRGLLALAYLETKRDENALMLTLGAQDPDPLALLTLAIHAYRQGRYEEALRLAEEAGQKKRLPVEGILAERVVLAASHALALAKGYSEEVKNLCSSARNLLSRSRPWPGQYLGVLSFLANLLPPKERLLTSKEGFWTAIGTGRTHRAIGFLQAWVDAALLAAEGGEPTHLQDALLAAQRLEKEGELGPRLAIPYALLFQGLILAYQGRFDEAVTALSRCRQEAKHFTWDVWISASQLLLELDLATGNLESAKERLSEIKAHVETYSLDPVYETQEALFLLRVGEVKTGMELLEKVASSESPRALVARAFLGKPVNVEDEPWAVVSLKIFGFHAPFKVLSLKQRALYSGTHFLLQLSERETIYLLALLRGPATAEELAERVYGDQTKVQAVHTAMSRLRSKGVPGLEQRGRKYLLAGYRLDIAIAIEAARYMPRLLQGLDLRSLLPWECPVCEEWREDLLSMAKTVAVEWARKGVLLPDVRFLDPEDPELLAALGAKEAIEVLKEGGRWW